MRIFVLLKAKTTKKLLIMLISKKQLCAKVLKIAPVTLWRKLNLFRSELDEDIFKKRILCLDEAVQIVGFFGIKRRDLKKILGIE